MVIVLFDRRIPTILQITFSPLSQPRTSTLRPLPYQFLLVFPFVSTPQASQHLVTSTQPTFRIPNTFATTSTLPACNLARRRVRLPSTATAAKVITTMLSTARQPNMYKSKPISLGLSSVFRSVPWIGKSVHFLSVEQGPMRHGNMWPSASDFFLPFAKLGV